MRLDQIIPDNSIRKIIYQIFGALGIVLGAVQVALGSFTGAEPEWFTAVWAVYGFLAGAGFTLSQANTVTPTAKATIAGTGDDTEVIKADSTAKHAG